MSYANATVSPAARIRAVSGVVAIHALLGAGVVLGLSVAGVIKEDDGILTTWDVSDPPPPPPQIEPLPEPAQQQYQPPAAPVPRLDFTRNDPIVTVPVTPAIRDFVIREVPTSPTPEPAAAPPAPLFNPVGPVPRGQQEWITTNDYSRTDLTREREGTASYRLVVGSDGRVDACEITRSSGHASLDTNTCRLLERRARFDAARDNRGERVVSSYTGSVTWQIPD